MDKESTRDGLSNDADYAIVKSSVRAADQQHQSKPPSTSDTLDLSKKKLCSLSEELYRDSPCIKNLHLEGNALSSLPESLFLCLSNLVWLDLRNNKITSLPSTIGKQRLLKYLLLEGNPIQALPVQLGDVTTLKALNLRNCPLEFPPEDVVCKGLESILSFLRNSKQTDLSSSDPDEPELPSVEKLDLKELEKSSMDLSDEEDKKKFELLKSKLEAREMEEMVQTESMYVQNRPRGVEGPNGWKFLTESRQATLAERRKPKTNKHAEEKERLAIVHQKMKNQEILKEWQKQTQIMQSQKAKNGKRNEVQQEVPVAVPPYATDLEPSQNWDKQKPLGLETPEMMPRIMSVKSLKEMEKARVSRDLRLEQRIREHIQAMQERKRNPKNSVQEEMEAARKELEMATLLQAEILQRKREQDTPLEYRFTAFTGEISPTISPRGKPPNIFTMTN